MMNRSLKENVHSSMAIASGAMRSSKKSSKKIEEWERLKGIIIMKLLEKMVNVPRLFLNTYLIQGSNNCSSTSEYISPLEREVIDDLFSEKNFERRNFSIGYHLHTLKMNFSFILAIIRKSQIDERKLNHLISFVQWHKEMLQRSMSSVMNLNKKLRIENEKVDENFKRLLLEKRIMLDVMALLQIQWDALCIEENPLEELDLNLNLTTNAINDNCVCDELFKPLNHSALFEVAYPSLKEFHKEILAIERNFNRLINEVEQLYVKIDQLTARRSELLTQISEKLHVTISDVEQAFKDGILTGTK